jgi:hypothetical protein
MCSRRGVVIIVFMFILADCTETIWVEYLQFDDGGHDCFMSVMATARDDVGCRSILTIFWIRDYRWSSMILELVVMNLLYGYLASSTDAPMLMQVAQLKSLAFLI